MDSSKPSSSSSKFVSEKEIDEARERRRLEWEKARANDPSKKPPPNPDEQPFDNRPLFAQLAEQKIRKQEEFDSQFKFSNMIVRYDEAETLFLTEVELEKQRQERSRREAEERELQAFRTKATTITDEELLAANSLDGPKLVKPETKLPPTAVKKDLQKSLLLGGAIVRKRKASAADAQTPSNEPPPSSESPSPTAKRVALATPSTTTTAAAATETTTTAAAKLASTTKNNNQTALLGLAYPSDDEEEQQL